MSVTIVEALSRHAAQSATRRGSLLSLGGVVAAAVAPATTQAKKKTKKGKKKAKRKAAEQAESRANEVCASQVAGCRAEILGGLCSLPDGKCLAVADCCSSFSVCDTTGFFNCIAAVS